MKSIKNFVSRHSLSPSPEAIELSPEAIEFRSIGDSHRDSKSWGAAAAAYSQYLDKNPKDVNIWIQVGNCHKEAGNFVESLTAYRKAQHIDPRSFEVHLQLGHLYKLIGHLTAALTEYEHAARLDPNFGEIRHEISALLERMKTSGWKYTLASHLSVQDLIDHLRQLPMEQDPFYQYFKSIAGYTINR